MLDLPEQLKCKLLLVDCMQAFSLLSNHMDKIIRLDEAASQSRTTASKCSFYVQQNEIKILDGLYKSLCMGLTDKWLLLVGENWAKNTEEKQGRSRLRKLMFNNLKHNTFVIFY